MKKIELAKKPELFSHDTQLIGSPYNFRRVKVESNQNSANCLYKAKEMANNKVVVA